MTQLSRRHFLKYTAASLAVLASVPLVRAASDYVLAGSTSQIDAPEGREFLVLNDTPPAVLQWNDKGQAVTNPGKIKALAVESGEVSAVDIPFFGHAVIQNPRYPQQVVTFEKWGIRGTLVDIVERKVLAMTESLEENVFFGHAAFNSDGSTLVTTEDHNKGGGAKLTPDENTGKGSGGELVLRNASDLKPIKTLSSYGFRPHQCCTTDNGKVIMVVNQGNPKIAPNIAWINFETGGLIHQVQLDGSLQVDFSHCDISFDNWVCVSGVNRFGAHNTNSNLVNIVSPEGQVFIPPLPDDVKSKMTGEALSVAFLGHSGLVAVTIPAGHMVLLFDYKKQALVEAVNLPIPLGVVPDISRATHESGMILNSKEDMDLISVVARMDGKSKVKVANAKFGGNGTHLTRMYI